MTLNNLLASPGFASWIEGEPLDVQRLLYTPEGKPRIAIISSQMGSDQRAGGGSYAYRASKAAALNLGRNLAADLRPRGIAVGIYHPGWVQTDMGGATAEITPEAAAKGLADRLAGLNLFNTGCFETWDGRTHPF